MTATVFSASSLVNMALRSSLFGFENEVYKWVSSLNIHESVFHLQPRLGQIAMGQSPNSSLGQRNQVGQAQPVPDSRHLPLSKFSSLYMKTLKSSVTALLTKHCSVISICVTRLRRERYLPGRLSRVTMILLTRGIHKTAMRNIQQKYGYAYQYSIQQNGRFIRLTTLLLNCRYHGTATMAETNQTNPNL